MGQIPQKAEEHLRAAAQYRPAFLCAMLATQQIRNGLSPLSGGASPMIIPDALFAARIRLCGAPTALRAAAQNELAELELAAICKSASMKWKRARYWGYAREKQLSRRAIGFGRDGLGGQYLPTACRCRCYESSFPLVAFGPNARHRPRPLVLALIRQESRFKAHAKSHAGARGLMQIMSGHSGLCHRRPVSLYRRSGARPIA